jgi:hypothetical protein
MKIITYVGVQCIHTITKYPSGHLCLLLNDVLDHSLVCICTTDKVPVKEKEMAIKDHTENEGILNALLLAELVTKPHRYSKFDGYMIPICYLK